MTETVVVTGGRGRSGRWICDHLAGEYHVVCVDLDHPGWEVTEREHVEFKAVDVTDGAEVRDLLSEYDPAAVVHWAAIPAPERHAGTRVFDTNVSGAYNVLDAAGRAGADIVWASSESAYGLAFAEETPLPAYLPIDEDHPMAPEDPYGTSKVAGEEIAKMVVRRDGVDVASVRPSWIQYPGEYSCRDVAEGDLAGGMGNCWSYVDVRDVASLVAAALDADLGGHEAFHAAAADNYVGRPTADLVEEHWGDVPERCELDGEQSALSTAKARGLLEWEPAHTWREAADADVPEPSLVGE
ncbi:MULTISPECIES: NAD-dependent epimerase/dehydratase family protein [Haloarcula]|uniref:NAD-dependent epimerase n=1 Tax=Haloarcula pellucida TaxID=1427151 RepID=A0A830GNX0_9EURY|nr:MULTISPECIES: NAD(P)-dependent oxidoreductase [Halomicroarcula]MBX0349238.1 NAD(P)-dependent oxidoreductase [Halomicroarcula pellucida]MDS0279171.1 NAD(P)-dependent oxidoreductase [Halomicroarcula sp. S1AR25-4]GGN99645.1 NAD-dependent epimerase [Halomicroarcula pellucida]